MHPVPWTEDQSTASPSLEILEAGTGHGSLTLHVSRAIAAANPPPLTIAVPQVNRDDSKRTPTEAERSICLPFVRRFIELSAPKAIMLTGNVSTQSLFPGAPGITRSRGKWREWPAGNNTQIPVMPVFHPAYLLRSPAQKRLAWADLLLVSERLRQV